MKLMISFLTAVLSFNSVALAHVSSGHSTGDFISVNQVNRLIRIQKVSLSQVLRLPENEFQSLVRGGSKAEVMKMADAGLLIACGVMACFLIGPVLSDIMTSSPKDNGPSGGGGA